MNMPFNAYEIEQARRQHMQEGRNREHLGNIMRAGSTKSSRVISFINACQRITQHTVTAKLPASPVSEAIQVSTNG